MILVDNMTNKKLTFTCLTLIVILIFPSISAFSIKTNNSEKSEVLQQTGSIYGNVEICRTGYIPHPEIPFALVDAEIKKVRCNIKGDYWIQGLPLDQTYNVTASAYRYFPATKTVTLTQDRPSRCVHLCLKKDYDSIEKDQRKNIRNLENFVFNLFQFLTT